MLLLAGGCASRGPVLPGALPEADAGRSVELTGTPFFPQKRYYCGPASLAMVLKDAGVDVEPDTLASSVYLPEKHGSLQIEMVAATRRYRRLAYRIEPELSALLAELRAGRPVVVFQNLGIKLIPVWHYAVVVGYDPGEDTIVLRSGTERRRVMDAGDFMETWERAGKWGVVVLRPGEMPVDPQPKRLLSAVAALGSVNPPDLLLQWLRPAGDRWPRDAFVAFALGNALYDDGRRDEAAAAYRRALSLDPHLVAARNNLAYLLAERGCTDQARAEIDRALEEAQDDDEALRKMLLETRSEIAQKGSEAGATPASCP